LWGRRRHRPPVALLLRPMAHIQPTTDKAFRNYVERLDDRTLFAVEEQLEQLVALPGWGVLTWMLGAGRENLIAAMVSGARVLEHTEYANRCGYIAGLEEAANAVAAVKAEAERRRQRIAQQVEAEGLARMEGESP
jgi:hypothetical protein